MKFILDFLFPPSCPVCKTVGTEDGVLCAKCWAEFNWISDPKCFVCGYPFPANIDLGSRPLCPTCASGKNVVDFMRSSCVYDDASKGVMLPFKHAAALKYRNLMARAMINSLRDLSPKAQCAKGDVPPFDLIMPVPLSYRRLFKRGYNQAALLARPIAKHFAVPMDVDSVRRAHRKDMGHKNAKERRANIRGVFKVRRPDEIKGKTILLVDDVMTTGATFYELRRVLKRAGAKRVYGVVFCRVVRAI
ncbi:MAG: ComF family protein [Alphaproteobacteria bacterium]|nr:ComF family protein [Alphaproteobacteria bacterium]